MNMKNYKLGTIDGGQLIYDDASNIVTYAQDNGDQHTVELHHEVADLETAYDHVCAMYRCDPTWQDCECEEII